MFRGGYGQAQLKHTRHQLEMASEFVRERLGQRGSPQPKPVENGAAPLSRAASAAQTAEG